VPYSFLDRPRDDTIPIIPIEKAVFAAWAETQPAEVRAFCATTDFKAEPGSVALFPGRDGRLAQVFAGVESHDGPWAYGGLPGRLPPGSYRLDVRMEADKATRAAAGWALGCYEFTRYKKGEAKTFPALVWPDNADRAQVARTADATFLVRDLINTPASDMGPPELAAACEAVARRYGAACEVIVGDDLLERNYPTIHAVGRAADKAPRLVDIRWGRPDAPKVSLCGKGVCFDTGGLDLKPAAGMLRMKKDMGGAATMLGLAMMIMDAGLDVRLRLLIPAVENSVSGNAMRPLDVITTRKGITVEVGNTDAEGRLILCDALAEADSESPALLVDCATLTGAARTALGVELGALFCNDDATAAALLRHGEAESDPMWRLPLWKPYRKMIESKVADINNVSEGAFAGAITAALYLESFVGAATPWVHLDVFAWNDSAKPGKPVGGEAMTMRALYALVRSRFAGRA